MSNLICFGQHLMMDCYNGNKEKLDNMDLIYNFLDKLPDLIGMTKMISPQIYRCDTGREEDFGISGFVIIQESHISLHTFSQKKYLNCDIFSCKEFDGELAVTYMKETFDIEKVELNFLNRGLEFPRNITLAKNITNRQRTEL